MDESIRKQQAYDALHAWKDKISKIFWAGAVKVPVRWSLIEKTKGKEWADVRNVQYENGGAKIVEMDEHCGYKFLALTEGVSYSGRLK